MENGVNFIAKMANYYNQPVKTQTTFRNITDFFNYYAPKTKVQYCIHGAVHPATLQSKNNNVPQHLQQFVCPYYHPVPPLPPGKVRQCKVDCNCVNCFFKKLGWDETPKSPTTTINEFKSTLRKKDNFCINWDFQDEYSLKNPFVDTDDFPRCSTPKLKEEIDYWKRFSTIERKDSLRYKSFKDGLKYLPKEFRVRGAGHNLAKTIITGNLGRQNGCVCRSCMKDRRVQKGQLEGAFQNLKINDDDGKRKWKIQEMAKENFKTRL